MRELLDYLARELVDELESSRFRAEAEWSFRHALVRDAAYATLVDDDRRKAHKAAAEWLERAGEPDPGLLAWHFDAGGEGESAAEHYAIAVMQLVEAGAFAAAIGLAERALGLTSSSELRGWLLFAITEAAFWAGDNARCARAAEEGMAAAAETSGVYGLCLARCVQMSTRFRMDAAQVGGSRALAFAPGKAATTAKTDDVCAEASFDAWLDGKRFPKAAPDDAWFGADPRRKALAGAGFDDLALAPRLHAPEVAPLGDGFRLTGRLAWPGA